MKFYFLFFILIAQSFACKYNKFQMQTCLKGFDKKGDGIGKDDINSVIDKTLHWYEKLVYPKSKILNTIENDCGFPLDFKKKTCFANCLYRESVYSRLCT